MTNNQSNLQPDIPTPSLRLGAISFVNTIPIYSDYCPAEGVQLIYDVPARLNEMMLSDQLEISPVSSACYLRNQDKLVLLDDLSVSSPGAVESVLFLSKKPLGPEMLDFSQISVPDDSETSVMLLAWLLREATGQDLRPWFEVYEASQSEIALKNTGNALVIGDNALLMREAWLAQQANSPCYCYDLSSLWKEKTGLPFVFAVWVANRAWAEEHSQTLTRVTQDLRQARNRFFSQPSILEAGLKLAQSKSRLPKSTLSRYYQHCLTYHLNAEHQAALAQFGAIIQSAATWDSTIRERQPS